MKPPETPSQRSLQKLNHQLSILLRRVANQTHVHGRTDLPSRGEAGQNSLAQNVKPDLISPENNRDTQPPRRPPAANQTKPSRCSIDWYKTITVNSTFPGVRPPVPPTNIKEKKFSREQLLGWDYYWPPSSAPYRVHERVVRKIDIDGFSGESLAICSPGIEPRRSFMVKSADSLFEQPNQSRFLTNR